MPVSDDVVAAARAGDAQALTALYSALAPNVLGYLRARGAEDPEGLTHEVFVQVLDKLGGVVGGAAGLRTFVFSVAHARLVDEHRRRARRPRETPYQQELDGRREPSAEATAMVDLGEQHVLDVLAELGEEQRSVITLRVLGDLTLEQTAHVLGKSVGAVKQLQRRGLLALRSLLERGEVAL
jgi:RNA polymerase sigma factor (sigma-70 family)